MGKWHEHNRPMDDNLLASVLAADPKVELGEAVFDKAKASSTPNIPGWVCNGCISCSRKTWDMIRFIEDVKYEDAVFTRTVVETLPRRNDSVVFLPDYTK